MCVHVEERERESESLRENEKKKEIDIPDRISKTHVVQTYQLDVTKQSRSMPVNGLFCRTM
jgi:hypothetical protein